MVASPRQGANERVITGRCATAQAASLALGTEAGSMKLLLPVLLLISLIALGCSKATRSDISEEDPEWIDEIEGEFDDSVRQTVRETAQAYLQTQAPDCQVEGISITSFTGNLFLVAMDASCGSGRKTIQLVGRRFYPPAGGAAYWRAEPLTAELAQALSAYIAKRLENSLERRQ